MTLSEWKDVLEAISYLTIVLGLPAALVQYRRKSLKEQQDREYGTYNALDEKYLEFQRMCFAHPHLDIFDIPDASPHQLTDDERKQELIAFTMLFSIFERAYLMYGDQSSRIKRQQWTGWQEYLTDFCARENFRRAWRISGNTFDTTFQAFVESMVTRVERTAPPIGTDIRELTAAATKERAIVVDLVANNRIGGSKLSSNELSYLLTTEELHLPTTAHLLELRDGTTGGLITTRINQILLITGIGVRGPGTTAVTHATLRALGSLQEFDGLTVMETPEKVPSALQQGVPGMGCFRELDVLYQYPDGSRGRLWIWTTADTMSRDEVATILRAIKLDFYGTIRARTIAYVTSAIDVEQRIHRMLPTPVVRVKETGLTPPTSAPGG